MKRVVRYVSLDLHYSDIEQTYIGADDRKIDMMQEETEEYMWQYNPSGYRIKIVE
jgi:hypothetical protein|nr:MAG TPA: HEXON PROTEIN, PENTON PROTEIN, PRE-CAPSID, ADENOVIRUS, CEMENT PROTEINS, PROTEIN.8A [Caudoviricetes sp.]